MFWLLEMDLRLVAVRQMGLSRLQSHGGPLQFWRAFFSHPVTKFGESVLSCSPRKKNNNTSLTEVIGLIHRFYGVTYTQWLFYPLPIDFFSPH